MKCRFVLDVDVDPSTMDDESKKLIEWKAGRRPNGQSTMIPYFPAGTEYEHDNAWWFVDRGMALPADDECEARCIPMTPEQRAKLQREYEADLAGVVDKDDRELFMAGVINGYEQVGGKTAYLPGPNYEKYKAAQAKIKATSQKSAQPI